VATWSNCRTIRCTNAAGVSPSSKAYVSGYNVPSSDACSAGRKIERDMGSARAAWTASTVNPGAPSSGSARWVAIWAWVRPGGTVTRRSTSGGSGSAFSASMASSNDESSCIS
jgi:hypothetical protein